MTGASVSILVVDDETPIRKLLRVGLGAEDFAVREAPTGRLALEAVGEAEPDLVLLDLGLPDIPGHDLLRRWREEGRDFPVIVLSSRTDEAGIVAALEQGADDYVTKPFGMKELAARLRVALRHRFQSQGERPVFVSKGLSVDLVKRIVKVEGSEVKLTPKEYDILRILVQNAGKVVTHKMLLEQVWNGDADIQYVRIYVRQLRQKIESRPDQPSYVTTETGVGYRLVSYDEG
ncbi:MAG: response regulator transcription factor [Methylobacterium mesophilicum]|nr:response regulator transcription factor [Methylobacterium mesophilicum]